MSHIFSVFASLAHVPPLDGFLTVCTAARILARFTTQPGGRGGFLMTRRLARLAAVVLAVLAACSGANNNSPVTTSLVVTANPTSVVANGKNTVTIHVEAATKTPITVRTLHGAFPGGGTAQIDGLTGDVTLTTCNAATDSACATSFDVLASDAANNAGHVTLRFSAPADCSSNCALDTACVGQACTPSGGAAGSGTCTGSPAACVANGGACTATQTTETTCNDGLDNDCNGLIDCADTACDGQPCKAGDPTWSCQSKVCTQSTTGYALAVAPTRTRLAPGSTTPVVVTVKNNGVAAPNVQVKLTPSAGTVATATQSTGVDGTATFSYTALNGVNPVNPGVVTLTASVTPASGNPITLDAKVTIPNLGSLVLGSVMFDVMGVSGSGYQEQNQLVVQALDDAGKAYPDGLAVTFSHVSVGGSTLAATLPPAALCTSTATCTSTGATTSPLDTPDSAGLASTWLLSGALAGPYYVTASATVGGVTRSFTFPTLFAIGAKASGLDFAIDCSPRNVPALAETDCSTSYVDATINCVARIKDRFGNLLGRQVPIMFRSEASGYGHVQTTPAFDPTKTAASQPDLGSAVEIFRTHIDGLPMDVAPLSGEPSVSHGDDGCGPRTHNPRDGVVTIIAIADGEESFVDVNGNGVYDGPGSAALAGTAYQAKGEPFADLGEPFVDANDNGQWDPGEWFYDVNGNGKYDGPNGKWDSQAKIWTQTVVVYTGAADEMVATAGPPATYLGTRWIDAAVFKGNGYNSCVATPDASTFSVKGPITGPPAVAATSASYYVVASDFNLNLLASTTSYSVTVDAPGNVVATYGGSAQYADVLGFAYSYWPCSGGTCSNECVTPGACTMQPAVGAFSCGVAAPVTITGATPTSGLNTVRWNPFTTYPVYGGSHTSTTTWPIAGTDN
jgi:hypothetical protein